MGTRRKLDIVIDAEYNGGNEITAAANATERLGLEADIAAQKQSMFNAKSKELASEVARGAKTMDAATDELKQYGDELERAAISEDKVNGASKDAGFSMSSLAGSVAVATGAIVAVGAAAKVAYDAINEGAALEAAAGKFDNLSASINTTGDSLLGKMREATKGMITDAELVAAGTDIMNLGLAKTEGGVVRMSAAVGALNLDMGVLAMTLANDSVMRLDALGLAMEDVNKTKKELISSGFIGDAFDEAVLIELEKKMVLLGDASLTTAGQLKTVETQWANATAEMKKNAAESAGPMVEFLSESLKRKNLLIEAEKRGLETSSQYIAVQHDINTSLSINSGLVDDLAGRIEMHDAALATLNETAATYLSYQQAVAESLSTTADGALSAGAGYETYTNAILGAQLQQENFNASQLAGQEAIAASVAGYESLSGFLGTLDGTATTTAASFQSLAASIIEQSLAAQVAAGEMTPLEAAISSINTQEGIGLVTPGQADELRSAALEFQNLNTILSENATMMAESGGVTVEQGQLIADKLALIGTTAISTDDQMRLMAINSGDALTTLGGDYTSLTDEIIALSVSGGESLGTLGGSFEFLNGSVDRSIDRVGGLKDLIIDGLPNEKVITIRIVTVGSVPNIPGSGSGAPGATGAGIPSAVSDALGG